MFYNILENIYHYDGKLPKLYTITFLWIFKGKTFSQTDQKKQPCLAAKACQFRTKFQFCFKENLPNSFNNRMRNIIHTNLGM